jgi:integrase
MNKLYNQSDFSKPARPQATAKASSLTNSQISKFLNDEKIKIDALLSCKQNSGLYLTKRKNGGTFTLRITIPNKGRMKISLGKYNANTNNQHHAAFKAREYVQKIKEGRDPLKEESDAREQAEMQRKKLETESITVGEFYHNEYRRYQNKKREGKEVLQRIKRNFDSLFSCKIKDIKHSQIREWEKSRILDNKHRDTIKADFSALNTMFNYAASTKIEEDEQSTFIERNPLIGFKLAEKTSAENDMDDSPSLATRRALTEQELECLHNGLDRFTKKRKAERRNSRKHGKPDLKDFEQLTYPHWLVPFTLLMLNTGLRQGDMYGLVWHCSGQNRIDLDSKVIFGTPEKTRDNKDPAKIVFPISEELFEILSDWWRDSGFPVEGYVFPNTSGGRCDRQAHKNLWKSILKLGDFPTDIEMYSLRHNFISILVASGTPLLHIAKLVGHKSTYMIEKHYGHLCPQEAEKIVSDLSKKLSIKPKD